MGTRSEWEDHVRELKAVSEGRGVLALKMLKQDPDLLKLFIVWPKVSIMWAKPQEGEDPDTFGMGKEAHHDRWAWSQIRLDYLKEVKAKMGYHKLAQANEIVTKARTLCLIFPDGTVNQRVLGILISQAGGELLEEIREMLSGERDE